MRNREKLEKKCLECGKSIPNRNKYCDNKCQQIHELNLRFLSIENGDDSLDFRVYKKYLIHIHGEKCMECGWDEKNLKSNTIPIELEHIDGDGSNNTLNNLKLLCPNCHSLTPTYKRGNRGNGRHNRRERYRQGKSY